MSQTPAATDNPTATAESLDRIESLILVLTFVGAALFMALSGSYRAFGVLVGGTVAFANFRILRILVKTFFVPKTVNAETLTRAKKGRLVALALTKFFGVYGGLYFLLTKTALDRVGFLIGFSSLVLAITVQGFRGVTPNTTGAARTRENSPAR